MRLIRVPFFLAVLAALLPLAFCQPSSAATTPWPAIGPDGGDARRFAFDPRDPSRIYLGTTDSWIYVSSDGGSSWARLAKLDTRDNLVIDSLVVDRSDPKTLYAGVWVMDHPDGGIYISHDEGKTWASSAGMQGQSVRALTQAASNPGVLVAGTLQGVYRSDDKGLHWREISPPGSREIHEVESIAIDPYDPQIIYAGTWHLPWKTSDNGAHWSNIKQGVIDDSDVFSMIIDPSQPSVMFLSACSGIYRSNNAGDEFTKVQGIPSTARRTRVLKMDPKDRNVVYAGTTEGLYKTADGGENWTRTTGPDVIINDVYVDPRNPKHILLATDRSGVLASEDAGVGFEASNTGFSQRQVAALLADAKTPGTMYAGVINDKIYGGVFVTSDFGRTWKQENAGLNGRDVFLLAQADDGTLLAGTSNGVYRWDGQNWMAIDSVESGAETHVASRRSRSRTSAHSRSLSARRKAEGTAAAEIQGRVTALSATGDVWYAATAQGLFRSRNHGTSWEATVPAAQTGTPSALSGSYTAVAVFGKAVFVGRSRSLAVSQDGGQSWQAVAFPGGLTDLDSLALTPDGSLWAGGREGVFYSTDQGHSWNALRRLPLVAINNVVWDAALNRILVTSWQGTLIFAVDPHDQTWKWWNTGWTVRAAASLQGRLAAASLFSGVVAQPQMESAAAGGGGVQDGRK